MTFGATVSLFFLPFVLFSAGFADEDEKKKKKRHHPNQAKAKRSV